MCATEIRRPGEVVQHTSSPSSSTTGFFTRILVRSEAIVRIWKRVNGAGGEELAGGGMRELWPVGRVTRPARGFTARAMLNERVAEVEKETAEDEMVTGSWMPPRAVAGMLRSRFILINAGTRRGTTGNLLLASSLRPSYSFSSSSRCPTDSGQESLTGRTESALNKQPRWSAGRTLCCLRDAGGVML